MWFELILRNMLLSNTVVTDIIMMEQPTFNVMYFYNLYIKL